MRQLPEDVAELDLNGAVLSVQTLQRIVLAIETNGAVYVKGAATHKGALVAQWLELVCERLQTRNTNTRRTDGPEGTTRTRSTSD